MRATLAADGRVALALGAARHRAETALWRTSRGARLLLERDLREVDRVRRRQSPSPLAEFERKVYSQNGEDGIIGHIMRELGTDSGSFVEIAAADGSENCTRQLAEQGWTGVWIEGDPELSARSKTLEVAASLRIMCAFVSSRNVCDLLRRAAVPHEFDLFVLDIDGADHSILRAVLERHRPKVIVHEYNGEHRYPWVMSGRRGGQWTRDWNFGASLQAYEPLLAGHGYSLVGCDSRGVNAFWVRGDVRPQSLPAGTASEYFIMPIHRPGSIGHPRVSPLTGSSGSPVSAGDHDALDRVEISRTALIGPNIRGRGEVVTVIADFDNRSAVALASEGVHPVHVAYQLLNSDGSPVSDDEPQRAPMSSVLRPGERRPLAVDVFLPDEPGDYQIALRLVHERVAWGAPELHDVATVQVRGDA